MQSGNRQEHLGAGHFTICLLKGVGLLIGLRLLHHHQLVHVLDTVECIDLIVIVVWVSVYKQILDSLLLLLQ